MICYTSRIDWSEDGPVCQFLVESDIYDISVNA